MNKLILAAMIVFTGFSAQAYEMAATGGMQTTDIDIDGADTSSGTGFYGGVLGFIEAGGEGYFRTGALLSMRKFERDFGNGVSAEASTTSIDVPLTYMMMLSEYASLYGGLKLGLNVSEDCTLSGFAGSCDTDATGMYYSLNLGGHFRFVPNFGIEVEYNMGLSEIAENVDYKSSLAVGVVYLF